MPTNNTNTTLTTSTPLSAMTGEEVASILVGLIRQNDGVLIQQKVTDGINQSIFQPLYDDYVSGRTNIVARMRAVGIDIPSNATYTQLNAKLGEYIALLLNSSQLIDSATDATIGDVLAGNYMKKVKINNVTSIRDYAFYNMSNLREVTSTSVTSVGNYALCASGLRSINLPNATSIQTYSLNAGGRGAVSSAIYINLPLWQGDLNYYIGTSDFTSNVKHFYGSASSNGSGTIGTVNNLYDLKPNPNGNANYSKWRPVTALNSASNSLCTPDEWDDENQPTFANNLQKFLWYFEYHFIPCFGTVSDGQVLSLYTTVWNAINSNYSISDPTKTLRQLLTAKGWEVASVS